MPVAEISEGWQFPPPPPPPPIPDDHQLYCMGKDFNATKHILEEEGERTAEWYRNNYLLVNPKKYQSFVLNPRNIDISAGGRDIKIKGKVIKNVNQIKLLGVNIDDNMNFGVHISEMCKKTSRKVKVLYAFKKFVTEIPVAAKLILPHLTYCQLVWHFCKSSEC